MSLIDSSIIVDGEKLKLYADGNSPKLIDIMEIDEYGRHIPRLIIRDTYIDEYGGTVTITTRRA